MTSTGIRELKDNLSKYVRRIEAGERIAVTARFVFQPGQQRN